MEFKPIESGILCYIAAFSYINKITFIYLYFVVS